MRERHFPSASVVVGTDGSRSAVLAALWAVDEAVGRDIPLRLVSAIPAGHTEDDAVRQTSAAVQSSQKPVKIEVEIVRGDPLAVLIDASRSAAVICVGAVGLGHFTRGRIGSTAAALANAAHCPTAIIRGKDRASSAEPGAILVEVDECSDHGAVLQAAIGEARLRGAPLRALTAWQSRFSDIHDGHALVEGNRHAQAQLDRLLDPWARRYPDVEVSSVVVHGNLVSYLATNAHSIQLVVVGTRDQRGATGLVGPAGNAALNDTDCSVLFVSRQHL